MDSPQQAAPASPRRRRQTFQCKECDEVFIDEESLRRHELIHKPVEETATPPANEEPPARPAPRRQRAAASDPGADTMPVQQQDDPSGQGQPPVRSLGQMRQAGGMDNPVDILGPEALSGGHHFGGVELDPTMHGLGPMDWEKDQARTSILSTLYGFFEDFSEWLFRGLQGAVGVFGLSLVPAVAMAIRGLLLLAMGVGLVTSGMWVGKKYGPALLGVKEEAPVLPPSRTLPASTDFSKAARQSVLDFYAAIDNRAYSVAYDSLTPGWRRELPFADFEHGFRNTQSVRCTIKSVRKLSDQKVEMDIALDVLEHGANHAYTGVYVAVRTDAGWKLDSGKIK